MASLRALIVLALALCLAEPALAQEAPQPVVTAVNAANADFVRSWNKQDPAMIAALFTSSALFVAPPGVYVGQPGVQRYYENLFATVHPSADFAHDIDHVEMLSDNLVITSGHWSLSRPALKGFWSAVYEHRSGPWVMRAHTYNITPPAPAPQGTVPAR
jgi:uncharacterized protein (TIGR02246 family)